MIVYKDILQKLKAAGYNTTVLLREGIIGQATLQAFRHNKHVNTKTINNVCRILHCQPGDIMEYVEDPETPTEE